MNRVGLSLFATVILAMAGLLISLNGCGSSASSSSQQPPGTIKHVVVIFQENRSTDNLFQDPKLISKGADIAQSGKDSTGNTIQLQKQSLAWTYNPRHSHPAFSKMCDLNSVSGQCQMDGADLNPTPCPTGTQNCTFSYVDPAEVQPYFSLAEQYVFADRMFQTNQGPSFPAHQFIISGTSAPSTGSSLFGAENPSTSGVGPNAGCDALPAAKVALIDPNGGEQSNSPIYPCFDHQTLTDLLEAQGRTWRYYTPGTAPHSASALWVGPEAIQHICGPDQPPPNGTACVGSDWTNHVIINQTQILADIGANQLSDVSWVIPTGQASDHGGPSDGSGPSWVASVVNAIGNSQYWKDTAIFITWDDWGGWYDHVPPPQVKVNCSSWGCGYIYGFRVPLIVVSAYAKPGYISKNQHDFGSILKFIETTFSLPTLGTADAFADDLSDCFNFNQTPITFQTIQSPLHAQDFLNDHRVPTDPDDD
jgi:phospholipase C